jgi:hypothetical protein
MIVTEKESKTASIGFSNMENIMTIRKNIGITVPEEPPAK